MVTITGRWLPAAGALALCALLGAGAARSARAREAVAGPETGRLRETVAIVDHAQAIEITHEPMPCVLDATGPDGPMRRFVRAARFTTTLGADWVDRFVDAMELDSLPTWGPGLAPDLCAQDPARSDVVTLVIGTGDDVVRVMAELSQGAFNLYTRGEFTGSFSLRGRADSVVALLRATLPNDTALVDVRACSAAPGAGAAADTTAPAYGQLAFVDSLPSVLSKVPPDYPGAARMAGVEGQVQVMALIGADGAVERELIRTSVPPLDAAALEAVRRWRFRPASYHGRPVPVWLAVPVGFRLH